MSEAVAQPSHLAISDSDKQKLFWASFLALLAAGMGFAFRVMVLNIWEGEFSISSKEAGQLFGASLWPIAVMMILFSLLIDKIGYKISMFIAFFCQAVSVFLTISASDFNAMWYACFIGGLGHGVIEACINPLCASIYRDQKTKMLNILHAAWPAGLAVGGIIYLVMFQSADETWATTETMFWFLLVPVVAYTVMFFMCKQFPQDERVDNNVSMKEMLEEFGGLGAFLAITFITYEFSNQIGFFNDDNRLFMSLLTGIVGGVAFGFAVKSLGKWIFFFLCVIMIPLATAEIATDGWIKKLMIPTLGDYAGWALVLSASIMMVLRFFAGVPLKFMSPVGLLLLSSVFSIIGLFALSVAVGGWVWIAFVFYAVGQTFYWGTMLGLVSEQYPKGGAMTINTVSAMGLLTVGIFGNPFLGSVQDSYDTQAIIKHQAPLVEKIKEEKRTYKDDGKDKLIYRTEELFGVQYAYINKDVFLTQEIKAEELPALKEELNKTARSTLRMAAVLPLIMAIAFILLLIYYRARGGYKPVNLAGNAVKPEEGELGF